MNLYFIKKPSLLRDGIQELLNRRLTESNVICRNTFVSEEITDASMILIDGNEVLAHAAELQKLQTQGVRIALWIEEFGKKEAQAFFKMGFDGYFYYDIDEETLIQAISMIRDQKRYVSPLLGGLLVDIYRDGLNKKATPPFELLSRREWEVLQLLAQGYNNLQIAEALFLSDKTIKNYVSSILHKLHVPDRTNAVLKALKKQWLYL